MLVYGTKNKFIIACVDLIFKPREGNIHNAFVVPNIYIYIKSFLKSHRSRFQTKGERPYNQITSRDML